MENYSFNDDFNIKELINITADKYLVVPDIHLSDYVFLHSFERNPNTETVVKRYFDRGLYAAERLKDFIGRYFDPECVDFSLLDFASGYGCVARHLPRYLPPATRIICCDIHSEAVTFISEKLNLEASVSNTIPEELHLDISFNVIFALSFFSHMPDKTWSRWLDALLKTLKPGGIIIFSTHGYESLRRANYPLDKFSGFIFSPASEQKDLDSSDYGNTIVSFDYVTSRIPQGYRIIYFQEADWEKYQDVYIIRRNG